MIPFSRLGHQEGPEPMEKREPSRGTYALSRILFLRGLGLVSLIAFFSLWRQILGLVGSEGIAPAQSLLHQVHERIPESAYTDFPTLCWLNCSDGMLTGLCALGVFLAVCLTVGVAQRLVLFLLWMTYLSLVVVGQVFLSYQWDVLLLESLFCSIWFAPAGWWRPRWEVPPPLLARWLIWSLCFKLMFLSGVTKLLSGDETWSEFTALDYHYFTQPIPNPLSWYVHHAPAWFQTTSLWLMYFAELIAPWLVFFGRWGRRVFAVSTMAFMVLIEATGNYGFFNLLTALLAVPLLDDAVLQRIFGRRIGIARCPGHTECPGHGQWRRLVDNAVAGILMGISLLAFADEMVRTARAEKLPVPVVRTMSLLDKGLVRWGKHVLARVRAWRTINGYGLFRVMTTERPEVVIEISDDAKVWTEFELVYKPGDVSRCPPLVAPHMPRLDWQMWFAALDPERHLGWLIPLTLHILQGSPEVAWLTGHPEIVEDPPRFVRLAYYRYEFTAPDERRKGGDWWKRTRLGELTPPIGRRTLDERRQ